MTISIKVGSAWKEATPHIKVGGTWKPVQEIWTKVSGAWKRVYQYLSISVSPTTIFNTGSNTALVTGGPATVTVTGGVGPFTYSWLADDNDDGIVVLSPSSASTSFRSPVLQIDEIVEGSFHCVVTDTGTGASYLTNTVSVTLGRIQ